MGYQLQGKKGPEKPATHFKTKNARSIHGAPDCGQNGTITVTKDLGSVPTRASTYEVYDEDGYMWWSGVVNFDANTCTSFQLTP